MATVTYYCDHGGYSDWTNAANAVDGSTSTYASDNTDYNALSLDSTTCDGTDLGTITSARWRAYGYVESAGQSVYDAYGYSLWLNSTSPGWGSWFDWATVQESSLTWANIATMYLEFLCALGTSYAYIARVEVEVTYTPSGGGASVVPVIMHSYRQRRN